MFNLSRLIMPGTDIYTSTRTLGHSTSLASVVWAFLVHAIDKVCQELIDKHPPDCHLLWRFVNDLIDCFDGDSCARRLVRAKSA